MKLSQDLKVGEKIFKAGTDCPKSEEIRLVLHNRDYLDLEYKDGLPIVPKEYEKYFVAPKTEMKIVKRKYDLEKLTNKLNDLKSKEFKEWAERTFGEDKIDRRENPKVIITKILRMQEAERR